MLSLCWFDVEPASATLAQHWTNEGFTYRVCWEDTLRTKDQSGGGLRGEEFEGRERESTDSYHGGKRTPWLRWPYASSHQAHRTRSGNGDSGQGLMAGTYIWGGAYPAVLAFWGATQGKTRLGAHRCWKRLLQNQQNRHQSKTLRRLTDQSIILPSGQHLRGLKLTQTES